MLEWHHDVASATWVVRALHGLHIPAARLVGVFNRARLATEAVRLVQRGRVRNQTNESHASSVRSVFTDKLDDVCIFLARGVGVRLVFLEVCVEEYALVLLFSRENVFVRKVALVVSPREYVDGCFVAHLHHASSLVERAEEVRHEKVARERG